MNSPLQVPGRHSISVVSPVYNGEASIAELCRRLNEVLPRIAKEYEIILVKTEAGMEAGRLSQSYRRVLRRCAD